MSSTFNRLQVERRCDSSSLLGECASQQFDSLVRQPHLAIAFDQIGKEGLKQIGLVVERYPLFPATVCSFESAFDFRLAYV